MHIHIGAPFVTLQGCLQIYNKNNNGSLFRKFATKQKKWSRKTLTRLSGSPNVSPPVLTDNLSRHHLFYPYVLYTLPLRKIEA